MIYRSDDENLPVALKSIFSAALERQEMMYRAVAPEAVKAEGKAGEDMVIEGWANLAEPDRWNEVIPPEAWDLTNFMKNPVMLREHNRALVVGKALKVEAKKGSKGLFVKAEIGNPKAYPLTPCQEETRSLLAQGYLKTFSVGFVPHVVEYDEDKGLLKYVSVELLEISVVAIPMQQDSIITSVKSWRANGMNEAQAQEIVKSVKETNDAVKAFVDGQKATQTENEKLTAEVAELKASNAKLAADLEAAKAATTEVETKALALVAKLRAEGILPADPEAAA